MGERTAVRWHGSSFFRLRGARGIISVWVQFRKAREQYMRIYVCVMGWDVV